MSTKCNIGYRTKNGKYKQIYCHWNGYYDDMNGVGYKLFNHYNTYDLVKELVEKGSLIELGHDKLSSLSFYERDKAKNQISPHHQSLYKPKQNNIFNKDQSYNYVFDNNEWYFSDGESGFSKLAPLISKAMKNNPFHAQMLDEFYKKV